MQWCSQNNFKEKLKKHRNPTNSHFILCITINLYISFIFSVVHFISFCLFHFFHLLQIVYFLIFFVLFNLVVSFIKFVSFNLVIFFFLFSSFNLFNLSYLFLFIMISLFIFYNKHTDKNNADYGGCKRS